MSLQSNAEVLRYTFPEHRALVTEKLKNKIIFSPTIRSVVPPLLEMQERRADQAKLRPESRRTRTEPKVKVEQYARR